MLDKIFFKTSVFWTKTLDKKFEWVLSWTLIFTADLCLHVMFQDKVFKFFCSDATYFPTITVGVFVHFQDLKKLHTRSTREEMDSASNSTCNCPSILTNIHRDMTRLADGQDELRHDIIELRNLILGIQRTLNELVQHTNGAHQVSVVPLTGSANTSEQHRQMLGGEHAHSPHSRPPTGSSSFPSVSSAST